jgi:hypothetical protein
LANCSVVLYQSIKIKNKWAYRKVSEELSKLSSGEYYVGWYEGSKKQMDRKRGILVILTLVRVLCGIGPYVSAIDSSGHDWSQEVCFSGLRSVDFADVDCWI